MEQLSFFFLKTQQNVINKFKLRNLNELKQKLKKTIPKISATEDLQQIF